MRFPLQSVAFAAITSLYSVQAAYTVLAKDFTTKNFFDHFDFFTGEDPTKGTVEYLSRSDAIGADLIESGYDAVYIGVDYKEVLGPTRGRKSVRIESKERFTHGLYLLDLYHMPHGCGTWPAFWTLGDYWPHGGEIDIIEGVHNQKTNLMALHTSSDCRVSKTANEPDVSRGKVQSYDCDVDAPDQYQNQGCSIKDPEPKSWGKSFNDNGGGMFAMEWNKDFIKVWMFPRDRIPLDAVEGNPEPLYWGPPASIFEGDCIMNDKFYEHKIIFNVAFCGDWAGGTWGESGCAAKASTCSEYVQKNPEAFVDAYWLISSLKVWAY